MNGHLLEVNGVNGSREAQATGCIQFFDFLLISHCFYLGTKSYDLVEKPTHEVIEQSAQRSSTADMRVALMQ